MTAKHRKGKGNHKPEDCYFKNEVIESEVRSGGYNPNIPNNPINPVVLVLFLMVVIGGAVAAWFCFQHHQTLTYLTDNVINMQMKIVTLQSSYEELRQSSGKQQIVGNLETRIRSLEESYALAQKQVGIALATVEQLKTSHLPAQVLALHTEMKARLAEMQQATVSLEQLSQLQSTLKGRSKELDGIKLQVEALTSLSAELTEKVGDLEERERWVSVMSDALQEHAKERLRLKQQMEEYHTQATVREFLDEELSQRLYQVSLDKQLENIQQQLIQLMGQSEPLGEQTKEAAATSAEQEKLTDVEEEAEEHEQAAAPIKKQDAVSKNTAPGEEEEEQTGDQMEADRSVPSSDISEVYPAQTEEVSEGEKVEESLLEEENHKVEEEASETEEDKQSEETAPNREGVEEESLLEEGGNTSKKEASEREEENKSQEETAPEEGHEEESPLEREASERDEDNQPEKTAPEGEGEEEGSPHNERGNPVEEEASETEEDNQSEETAPEEKIEKEESSLEDRSVIAEDEAPEREEDNHSEDETTSKGGKDEASPLEEEALETEEAKEVTASEEGR